MFLKYLLILTFYFGAFGYCDAQKNFIYQLANTSPKFISVFSKDSAKTNQVLIEMPFDNYSVSQKFDSHFFDERIVLKIELLYTKYRKSADFNQKKLNRLRLEKLKSIYPMLFEDPLWNFELVSQTQCNDPTTCLPVFHGFIITYRPNSSSESLKKEASYLQNYFKRTTTNTTAKNKPRRYTFKSRWDDHVGFVHDTVWLENEPQPDLSELPEPPAFFYDKSLLKDTTLNTILKRGMNLNNHTIVVDATGSMLPYNLQIFNWLEKQVNSGISNQFVFFNDGNTKPSSSKEIGYTGGIYSTASNDLKTILGTATLAMEKGDGGGERFENDIEAILDGLATFPDSKGLILVADNYEKMRDYSLIEQINQPIKIILCGGEYKINTQYLDLARATKGSLHTKDSDVFDLHKLDNGESITIEGNEYVLKKGKFKLKL